MAPRLGWSRLVPALALVAFLCFARVDHAACNARSFGLPRLAGRLGGLAGGSGWSFFRPPGTGSGGGSGATRGGQNGQGGFGGGMSGQPGGSACGNSSSSRSAKMRSSNGKRVMTSNGCPGYAWRVQGTVNTAVQQTLSFSVPLAPTLSSSSTRVGVGGCKMGPIGFALNGVPFYSACDALGRDALKYEGASFDGCAGHPSPFGQYHYHLAPGVANPSAISGSRTATFQLCSSSFWQDTPSAHSPLVGFLADGIPLYGPRGAGGALPAGLDECNGHVGDGSAGEPAFYHYHTTSTAPYTVACLKGCVSASDWSNVGSASCTKASQQYDYLSLAAVQAA
ncbi:hypothetical protein CLOP_g23391 [Closterium sp. NIES-67]|nr:hypothetical protein CLOP_g23391 [Closterium sp. NIES-67]